MSVTSPFLAPLPDLLAQGGVLTPAIRRDLSDLNRQFLELGLADELAADPRFAWSEPVRARLAATDAATRDRMAACPFALFELHLPRPAGGAEPPASRVADNAARPGPGEPWSGRCLAFAHFVLFVALRLADAAPLATRIALGLSPGDELRLNELCPSEAARIAARPEAIRPRWPEHPRFWELLRNAARANSPPALRLAHCAGICLLGAELNVLGATASTPSRKPPR